MGLLTSVTKLWQHKGGPPRRRLPTESVRRCMFEAMEPRQLLDAVPLYFGAVYVENDRGSDVTPDTFELTFVGGAPDTSLTRVEISGDQNQPGLSYGDMIFDTQEGGLGADHPFPFTIVAQQTRNPNASVRATVEDGSTLLVLELTGFQAGDKLTFSIDVDEVQRFDPAITDLTAINDGIDPIASGVEFHGSHLTAAFSAPHYYPAAATTQFYNAYDVKLAGSGLDLPPDNANGQRDRSTGAVGQLQQEPLPVAISGLVYLETNLDLHRDPGELGLAGVRLELWRLVSGAYQFTGHSTITAADGQYTFGLDRKLPPGVYQVRESQPEGLFSVGAIPGTVDARPTGQTVAGNPDVLTEIALPLGDQRGVDYNFAEARPAKISGYVYHDRDNDGRRDPGEEGIANANVQVVPVQTVASAAPVSVATDASGFYQVTGLAPGTYRVIEIAQPAGYLDGLDAAGLVDGQPSGAAVNPGDRIETIFLGGGQTGVEYDFGELVPATLSGHVRLADENGDCFVAGAEERPVVGATVRLLDSAGQILAETQTDTHGEYRFTGLWPGVYAIVEITPPDLIDGEDHVGRVGDQAVGTVTANDTITSIVLASGQTGVDYDFCEHLPATLSGNVSHDRNNNGRRETGEEGLAAVQVTLLDANGQEVASATTDAQGRYEFTRLSAGVYAVVETQPAGWVDGLDAVGTIGGVPVGRATNPGDRLSDVHLHWGEHGIEYNFGELHYAVIEGSVHLTGPDGDCFTPGGDLPPLAGVQVVLQNDRGATIAQTTTDADGRYRFEGLMPGSYTVIETTPANLLDGEDHVGTVDGRPVGELAGNDVIRGIVVTSGQVGTDYDFCEHLPASLSGFVYHDANRNGKFDAAESPIANAEITLRGADGRTAATARTGRDGSYSFTALSAGTYAVTENQPEGFLDGQDAAGTIDGQVVGTAVNPGDEIRDIRLRWGEGGVHYDFGEVLTGSLEGSVHADLNRDCVFDDNEWPIAGVTIELRDAQDQVIATTKTDSHGHYRFDNLPPGTYTAHEQQPAGYFQGGQHAGSGGGDDSLDDIISQIALGSGQHLIDYDFCEIPPASLSGSVHADSNQNCTEDPGEPPIGGVAIDLLNEQGVVIGSTTTDTQGQYRFDNLRPGTYAVREHQPAGYLQGSQRAGSGGGDDSVQDLISAIPIPAGAQLIHYDFCEILPSSLSGQVFVDLNLNVIRDAGEAVLPGVTIRLLDARGQVVSRTRTDGSGEYRFDNLMPGQYAVQEEQPADYFSGGQKAGSHGGDARVENLISAIAVPAGQELIQYDFAERPPGRLSGDVFQDGGTILTPDGQPPKRLREYRDGQWAPGDKRIAGVVLELRDGVSGDPITADVLLPGLYPPGRVRTTTDQNGHYEFRGLPRGNYAVYEIQPEGYVDGLDTPGTTNGLAINPDDDIDPLVIQRLSTDPQNDAIILIPLGVGAASEHNNFSEVLVAQEPIIPPPPPPVIPSAPPVLPPPLPPAAPPLLFIVPPPAVAQTRSHFGAGGLVDFTWHLSVIDAGRPRGQGHGMPLDGLVLRDAAFPDPGSWRKHRLREGRWLLRTHLNDPARSEIREIVFGIHGGIPVAGDWNGDGIDEIGVYFRGRWFLDLNGNGAWDEDDLWAQLGDEYDLPVTGDWNGDGKDDIGIFGPEWAGDQRAVDIDTGLPDLGNDRTPITKPKNMPPKPEEATDGVRLLQRNAQGTMQADVIDHVFRYGSGAHIPVAGDWTGDGIKNIGVFHNGVWRLDTDGDGRLSASDRVVRFGQRGDIPVVGDFNGDGIDEIGVYRDGKWIIDIARNYKMSAHDKVFELGEAGDIPVVGDWDGDGSDDAAVYRDLGPHADVQQARQTP